MPARKRKPKSSQLVNSSKRGSTYQSQARTARSIEEQSQLPFRRTRNLTRRLQDIGADLDDNNVEAPVEEAAVNDNKNHNQVRSRSNSSPLSSVSLSLRLNGDLDANANTNTSIQDRAESQHSVTSQSLPSQPLELDVFQSSQQAPTDQSQPSQPSFQDLLQPSSIEIDQPLQWWDGLAPFGNPVNAPVNVQNDTQAGLATELASLVQSAICGSNVSAASLSNAVGEAVNKAFDRHREEVLEQVNSTVEHRLQGQRQSSRPRSRRHQEKEEQARLAPELKQVKDAARAILKSAMGVTIQSSWPLYPLPAGLRPSPNADWAGVMELASADHDNGLPKKPLRLDWETIEPKHGEGKSLLNVLVSKVLSDDCPFAKELSEDHIRLACAEMVREARNAVCRGLRDPDGTRYRKEREKIRSRRFERRKNKRDRRLEALKKLPDFDQQEDPRLQALHPGMESPDETDEEDLAQRARAGEVGKTVQNIHPAWRSQEMDDLYRLLDAQQNLTLSRIQHRPAAKLTMVDQPLTKHWQRWMVSQDFRDDHPDLVSQVSLNRRFDINREYWGTPTYLPMP